MNIRGDFYMLRSPLTCLPVPDFLNSEVKERMLTAPEVAQALRISVATVRRGAKEGRLPQPVSLSPRCQRWRLSDIRASVQKP